MISRKPLLTHYVKRIRKILAPVSEEGIPYRHTGELHTASGRRETEAAVLLGVTGEQPGVAERAGGLCRAQQVTMPRQGTAVWAGHCPTIADIPPAYSQLILSVQAGSTDKNILFKIKKYSHSFFSSSDVFSYSP